MSKLSQWNIFWGFLVTFQDIFVKLCPKILSQKVWRSSFCRTNPAEAGMSKWWEWKLNICFSSSAESLWSSAQVRAGEFRTSGGSGNLFDSFLSHSFFLFLVIPCSLFACCYPSLIVFAQAIEKAEANVVWMEANYQPIWSWLKEQNKVGNEIKDMQNLQTNKQTMEANCQPIWSWLKDQNKVRNEKNTCKTNETN